MEKVRKLTSAFTEDLKKLREKRREEREYLQKKEQQEKLAQEQQILQERQKLEEQQTIETTNLLKNTDPRKWFLYIEKDYCEREGDFFARMVSVFDLISCNNGTVCLGEMDNRIYISGKTPLIGRLVVKALKSSLGPKVKIDAAEHYYVDIDDIKNKEKFLQAMQENIKSELFKLRSLILPTSQKIYYYALLYHP